MKTMLRALAIFLICGGLLIVVMANMMEENAKPNKVTFGISVNDTFIETDSGYIGGSSEAEESAGYLNGIGLMTIGLGVAGMVGSFFIKSSEQ